MSLARLNSRYVETVSKHAVACSEFNEGTAPGIAQKDVGCVDSVRRAERNATIRRLDSILDSVEDGVVVLCWLLNVMKNF